MSTELKDAPSDFVAADFPQTDSAGDVFDPELHAAKPDGTPATKTDGTFRKKRRDAGRGRVGATRTSTRSKSTSSGGTSASAAKLLAEQRDRHIRGVHNAAAIGLTPLSFVFPVDAYTLGELVPSFAEALADYAPENPQVAAALDKLSAGGGLFAVLAVVGLGVVQVMHNHGKVPEQVARIVGVKPLSETQRIMEQRARAMAQQAGDVADAA